MANELMGPPVSRAGSGKPSLLSRVGKGLVSFGTGIPQIELDQMGISNRNNTAVAGINEARLGQVHQEQAREMQIRQLEEAAARGEPGAMRDLVTMSPSRASALREGLGITTPQRQEQALSYVRAMKATNDPAIRAELSRQRSEYLPNRPDSEGGPGNPIHTMDMAGMSMEEQDRWLPVLEAALQPGVSGFPAATQDFNYKLGLAAEVGPDGQPTRRALAAQIDLGIKPRAVGSSSQTIADEGTTDAVAASEAAIGGAVQGAKTKAQIAEEVAAAEERATAEAKIAELRERAIQGERIKADKVRTQEEALVLLPDAEAGHMEVTTLLGEIRNHPKLADVLGFVEGRTTFRLDVDEANLLAKIRQVEGKSFLEGYQSLKGGGPITDIEGRAASEAQSRVSDRTVGVEHYQDAIDDLISISDARLARLRRKAGLSASGAAVPNQQQIQYLIDNPQFKQAFIEKFGEAALPEGM